MRRPIKWLLVLLLASSPAAAFNLAGFLGGSTPPAGDTTPPDVSSTTVGTDGDTVTVVFTETVVTTAYDDGDLELDCDGASGANNALTSIAGTGDTRTFTATSTVQSGETCTLASNASADEIEDAAGNDLSLTETSVTNNSTQGGAACADSSCAGFLVCQNFEGTGYDNSETWVEEAGGAGTIDEDDTTATVLRGSQHLFMQGGTGVHSTDTVVSASGTVWAHVLYKPVDSTPTGTFSIVGLYNGNTDGVCSTLLGHLEVRTDGKLRLYHGTAMLGTDDVVLADNTPIHIWISYTAGTGSNGTMELYWSSTATRPSLASACFKNPTYTPGATCDNSVGTSTADVSCFSLRETDNRSSGEYFDQVLLSASEITDVCN